MINSDVIAIKLCVGIAEFIRKTAPAFQICSQVLVRVRRHAIGRSLHLCMVVSILANF